MVLVLLNVLLEVAELMQMRAAEQELRVLVVVVLLLLLVLVQRADCPGNVCNLLLLMLLMAYILGVLQLLLARCHFILLLRDLYPHSITRKPAIQAAHRFDSSRI